MSLEKGSYRYQFRRFGFSVVTAIAFAYMANCFASLIQFGRVWALFVPLIVSVNDTMAYVCGVTTGKTPLISLSPNKTVEGFVGGAIFTHCGILCRLTDFQS